MKRGLNKENSLPDPEFGGESSESARAIHYVVQKDTLMTYEKGLFAQAEPGIASGSTIERKKMSTKTIYKRIALVAVAALGAGVLSVAPANATAITAWTKYEGNVTAINLKVQTATPVTGADVYVNVGAKTAAVGTVAGATTTGATTQIRASLSSYPAGAFAAVTSSTNVEGATAGTATVPTGAAIAASSNILAIQDSDDAAGLAIYDVTASTTTGIGSFKFTPTVAGTYVLTVFNDGPAVGATTIGNNQIDSNEAVQTISITVAAAPTLDLGLSTAFMTGTADGALASSTTNAVARTAVKTAGTYLGQIKVTLLKADGNADTAAHAVTADVSGVGYVGANVTPDVDPNLTTRSASNSAAASVRYIHIEADGTAGEGSVTVSVTHAVTGVKSTLGTFKYTTYADVAKLEVSTKNFTIGLAGGDSTGQADATRTVADNAKGALDDTTSVPAFIVKATDANGRVANAANVPTIVSSSTAVVASGSCALDGGAVAGASSGTGVGFYNCAFVTAASSKSGDKATLTIRIVDPADATKFITTTIDVTVGGSISTETIAFNKASYAAGEGMVITRTGKDSAGNPVADGSTAAAITFSTTVGGTTPAAGFYVGGVSASSSATANPTVFAPATPGAFQALMTSSNAAATKLTASATVAQNADISALTTLVNSLIAKINALNKLVVKIQKKVRA
jgi:trimeric autotransporter adhesin